MALWLRNSATICRDDFLLFDGGFSPGCLLDVKAMLFLTAGRQSGRRPAAKAGERSGRSVSREPLIGSAVFWLEGLTTA